MRALLAAGLLLPVLRCPTTSPHAAEAGQPSAAELMDALMWGREPIGGPFELIDHAGRRRTDADFRGKLLLIYFGYTYCPDVCPTDLQAISAAVDLLGAAGEAVQPLFITVDPARDTAEHLAGYIPLFHPRLIGLTGQPGEIRRVARAYKVYYAKVRESGGRDYAIDHTGFIYLVGADGRYLGFFPPGTPPERLVAVIRPHLPPASGR
jgi:protein SCO1/2